MYRAGPAAGGLPLPRVRLGLLTGAIAATSVLAIVVPLVVMAMAGRSTSGFWRMFKEGGAGMYFLLLFDLALPVALGITAAVAVRGKRVPAGLSFGVAALPLFVSVFFAFLANRLVDGALAGESVDPSMALRIDAEGLSEALNLDIFGGLVACGSAIIATVGAASVVASIDVAAATRAEPSRPSAVFGAASLVSGAAWFVAVIVVTALRLRTVGSISIVAVMIVGTLVPFAVLAARSAPVLRAWHDPIEARRGASALLVALLSMLLATLAFERAALAAVGSTVFGAISGSSIDPSQKARILMELVDARKWNAVAVAVHAVLGTATFALALAGAMGNGPSGFRHPASPSSVIALSVGVFVLASAFALSAARGASTERIAARAKQPIAPEVTLPVIDAELDEWDASEGGGQLVLSAAGKELRPRSRLESARCASHRRMTVFADARATIGQLAEQLPLPECRVVMDLAATPRKDPAADGRLGDLALFLHLDHVSLSATFDPTDFERERSSGFLTVRSNDERTIQYEDHEVKLPVGAAAPDLRASSYASIRFVVRPEDSIGHVVDMLAGMKQRFRGRIPRGNYYLEIAWPPRPMPNDPDAASFANLPKGIHFLAPIVAGRLSPEVVTRVVRKSTEIYRRCYEGGLAANPKLAGTVRVKFVIDRAGAVVSAADAASTLPDRAVTSCIVRAIGALGFPQPDGGIVVVTMPMTLAP